MTKRVSNKKGQPGRSPKYNRWIRAIEYARMVKNTLLRERADKAQAEEEKAREFDELNKLLEKKS